MTRVYGSRRSRMLSEEDQEQDSHAKCRERRRRRIEMRRLPSVTGAPGSSVVAAAEDNWQNQTIGETAPKDSAEVAPTSSTTAAAIMSLISIMETPPPPVYGTMSVVGRSREMEDEISVRTNLCRPEINGYRPVHFFGVFDGHGGRHVSALCRENMHVLLEEELMRVKVTGEGSSGGGVGEQWTTAINRSFQRMDEIALRLCLCGGLERSTICRCNPQLAFMGSTAVVSIVTQEYIIVANCGDSRAVLSRGGSAIPLSTDQKPDREDERARIEACGGRIMFTDGARVEGILAMSRAIGDRLLKQSVISKPEITITRRETGDECLILASDGLWDVLSNELACELVHECLLENRSPNPEPRTADEGATGAGAGELYTSQSASAAALLVRLALGRRSSDNISVIVVDLRK